MCIVVQNPGGFRPSMPTLASGGVMPQLSPPVYPSRCIPPRSVTPLTRRRRHNTQGENASCRTLAGCIIRPRPGILPLALPHPTPRPPRRARQSLGLVPYQRQARPMSRPASFGLPDHAPLWPMQCAQSEELSYPPTPSGTGTGEMLALPYRQPLNHPHDR